MKVSISNFYTRAADQKAFKKGCKGKAWFVHSSEGVWYFPTEQESQDHRKKLKDAGVFATVHHVLDVIW